MLDQAARRLAQQRQLPALVERALRESGVAGVFPTPLAELQEVLGIEQVLDMSNLPDPPAAKKPRRWKRILGALLYSERTIFVDFSQGEERSNFTEAHETAHRLIPWHEDSFVLDHENTLFRDVKDELEREANYTATYLIFQNGRFHRRALDHERSIKTPILLAADYRASRHATIRHYVEGHPDPLALLVTGRFARDAGLPIWTAVESEHFRNEYGSVGRFFRGTLLLDERGGVIAELALEALGSPAVPPKRTLRVRNLRDESRPFVAEAFFNQHCLFIMFSPRSRIRTGRRVAMRVDAHPSGVGD